MAEKQKRNLRVRKMYPEPIGRIQISTKSRNKKVRDRLLLALELLWDNQKIDTLIAIRDGRFKVDKVLRHHKAGTLLQLDFSIVGWDLAESFDDYLTSNRLLSDSTLRGYRGYYDQLLKIKSDAEVSDLPWMLERYKRVCISKKIFTTFNRTRAAVQSFIQNTPELRDSQLYRDVVKVKPFEKKFTSPQVVHKPFHPYELTELFKNCSPRVLKYKDIIWFLCLHGFRRMEYLEGNWIDHGTHLEILGTKTEAAKREVPKLMEPPKGEPISYNTLRRVMKDLGDRTPHDTRRTYQTWLGNAGIQFVHAESYMGHETKTMMGLYTHTKDPVSDWILGPNGDKNTFLRWLEREKVTPPVHTNSVPLFIP